MRDITQCHPRLQVLADDLVVACERKGLRIQITECLRTVAEQDGLYAQGRTKPGRIVTRAKGSSFSSMHQWGVAFDFCRNDGRGSFDNSDGFFQKIGAIGKTLGLEWGGDWVSIKDYPHFQLPDWGSTTTRLKQMYGTPEKFRATWQAEIIKKPLIIDEEIKKYGEKKPKKKYEILESSFVRSAPSKGDATKVKYDKLDDITKGKSKKVEGGYAKWIVGKKFDRVRSHTGGKGNKWLQTAKGYWIIAVDGGEKKVKVV